MVYQASVFTLHGGKKYVKGMKAKYPGKVIPPPVSLDEIDRGLPPERKILRRYSISSNAKEVIFEQLFNLGIHEGTLFPEVDHQALYLQKLWWYPRQ